MNVTEHIIHCCDGCLIDDMRFCKAVPDAWAIMYRAKAEESPDAHESFVRKIIMNRITGHD